MRHNDNGCAILLSYNISAMKKNYDQIHISERHIQRYNILRLTLSGHSNSKNYHKPHMKNDKCATNKVKKEIGLTVLTRPYTTSQMTIS
ncbi:hypothetical protein VC83_09674 [Pseudogymnoascus destructans]|uniref:Uncharacterized protein n=1 Tax=Pseudogymnoascus destructans TaxID=655981 RepID=A0A2P6FGN9_9PEZI|nr:uncharacterized protein VC83_09674 [Pseudogymnoascus destructans]PQM43547.1 hypothetical protein VC83_09674 [Pseudogymnoascus destructans]